MVPHLFAIVSRKRGDDSTRGHIPFFPLLSQTQRVDQEREQITHFNEHYFVFPSHNYIQGMIQVPQQNPSVPWLNIRVKHDR